MRRVTCLLPTFLTVLGLANWTKEKLKRINKCVLSVNADCFLIELASLEETLALYNKLQNTQLNGIKDLVPAAKQFWFSLMRSKPTLKRWLL